MDQELTYKELTKRRIVERYQLGGRQLDLGIALGLAITQYRDSGGATPGEIGEIVDFAKASIETMLMTGVIREQGTAYVPTAEPGPWRTE